MFLADSEIRKAVAEKKIVLSPFDENKLKPASYDITLGDTFIVTDAHSTSIIDPVKGIYPKTQEIKLATGEAFILHPGVSILGFSAEHFGSDEYMIEVNGKSSLARIGLLVHNSASLVNPGHYLKIALELCNLNEVPIVLRPGMSIAQLTFSTMQGQIEKRYAETGRYAANNERGYAPPKGDIGFSSVAALASSAAPLHSSGRSEEGVRSRHPEEQYLDLLRECTERGDVQTDKGTGVKTYSLFGRQMRFDLSDGFPMLTTKRVYWKGVLHELYWFFSGQSNIRYLLDHDVHIWDDYPYKLYTERVARGEVRPMSKEEFIGTIKEDIAFAREYGELPHIYGELWRRWSAKDGRGIDQLAWVIEELKKDPDCHNALVTSWNPEYLYSMAKPEEASRFPICHNLYQFNVKNGKLCLQLYQRSADIFLGVPFNIASYSLLLAVVAKMTGYEPGEFVHTFGDVHIYENHLEAAREQLSRTPHAFPHLTITDGITLDSFRPEHVALEGYAPHGTIKADLTVAGGYNATLHTSREGVRAQ